MMGLSNLLCVRCNLSRQLPPFVVLACVYLVLNYFNYYPVSTHLRWNPWADGDVSDFVSASDRAQSGIHATDNIVAGTGIKTLSYLANDFLVLSLIHI